MKKQLFILFIFCSLFSEAQNPLVKMWDKRYGGTDEERFYTSLLQTKDHGFILGGASWSGIGGDKTEPAWDTIVPLTSDYWIVKLDSFGNKQWDKTFGGTGSETLKAIRQTTDGGYILTGNSNSPTGGDKTQPCLGFHDYWIIKTDSAGNKLWDRTYGGFQNETAYALELTSDGGYIIAGSSTSGISGDKTQNNWGMNDFWIVRLDSLGNKIWDQDLGGYNDDVPFSIVHTNDNSYLISGYSQSGAGGDKSQPNWGATDYWVVKIDSLGNKQFDKDFGGSSNDYLFSAIQIVDGGYILGGWSQSGISGDKTQNVWGNMDYWIIKIDSTGNKLWDQDFGGVMIDDLYFLVQASDGGFLLSGASYSPMSGNKTEDNLGYEQTWIIKTDSIGNKIWDKTILSSGHDEFGQAIQTYDGCYVAASYSNGGVGGEKSQPAWNNSYDFWLVKFCEVPTIVLSTPDTHLCPGACTDFFNLSLNATIYQWNFPGAIPDTSTQINPTFICYAASGSYDVQLIATNANGSDTLLLANYITVYPTPSPQGITQNGDTLFAIAGAASYQWYYNTNVINGATNNFYVAPQSGDYNVVATDANGCEVEAAVFNVIAGLTLTLSKGEGITAEPNPFSDKITIHFPSSQNSKALLKIFNSMGEAVLEKEIKPEDQTLNLAALPQGIYLLSVLSEDKVYNQKIVK